MQTWSTANEAQRTQFSYWRELICEAFLSLTPEALAAGSALRDGFAGKVTQWSLGDLHLGRIDSQRQRVRRTERDIARSPVHGYYANLQVRGTSRMAQGGRVTTLRPGDIAVVDTSLPFTFDFDTDFRQLTFFLPARVLDDNTSAGVPTATRLDTTSGIGAAVRHALTALSTIPMAPDAAARLAMHAGGMLAVALDRPVEAPSRSSRTYAAAIADIEEHLTDDDLAPAATARRLGVSVRWLHGLFAGQERSYAATVRRMRLERARRDLQDPARRHLRVIDIAVDAGFGSIASFHRAFLREFGLTPARIRVDGGERRGAM